MQAILHKNDTFDETLVTLSTKNNTKNYGKKEIQLPSSLQLLFTVVEVHENRTDNLKRSKHLFNIMSCFSQTSSYPICYLNREFWVQFLKEIQTLSF